MAAIDEIDLSEQQDRLEWVEDSCAVGSAAECVVNLQRWRDAGADEIVIYGSNPTQNEQSDAERTHDQPLASTR